MPFDDEQYHRLLSAAGAVGELEPHHAEASFERQSEDSARATVGIKLRQMKGRIMTEAERNAVAIVQRIFGGLDDSRC